jgi:hypothetical protein
MPVSESSLAVLYYLTDARTAEQRDQAREFAVVVDHLHHQSTHEADVARYLRDNPELVAGLAEHARTLPKDRWERRSDW